MTPDLKKTVRALADAIRSEFDIHDPYVCSDVSEIAFRLLEYAGFSPVMLGAGEEVFDGVGAVRALNGHDWIRVGDWNIDFGAGQFGLPYPFVTEKDSARARRVYGLGSSLPSREYVVTFDARQLSMYPSVERVLNAKNERALERMGETPARGPVMFSILKKFRANLRRAG